MLPLKAATSCSSAYAHQLILWGVRTSVVNQMTGEGVSLTSRSLRRQQRHADFLLMVDSMQYPARTNTWRSRKGSGAHILWGFRFIKVCAPKTAAHDAEHAHCVVAPAHTQAKSMADQLQKVWRAPERCHTAVAAGASASCHDECCIQYRTQVMRLTSGALQLQRTDCKQHCARLGHGRCSSEVSLAARLCQS